MDYWLVNHSWQSFKSTKEYCGFVAKEERDKISVGSGIVYFGQGLVFGVFEAAELVDDEFTGWKRDYTFQVKLKPIAISARGLAAKPLEDKIQVQKIQGGSSNLLELNEKEFNLIKNAVESNQKELKFS